MTSTNLNSQQRFILYSFFVKSIFGGETKLEVGRKYLGGRLNHVSCEISCSNFTNFSSASILAEPFNVRTIVSTLTKRVKYKLAFLIHSASRHSYPIFLRNGLLEWREWADANASTIS